MQLISNRLEYCLSAGLKTWKILRTPYARHLLIVLVFQILIFDHALLPMANAEHYEFKVSNPMIVLSLRSFIQSSSENGLYVSKGKNGSVILRADEGYGLMTVVQQMNLQDLHNEFKNTNDCFDYLKISELNGTRSTGELCGGSENYFMQQASFVDKKGQTELTYVLHDKLRVTPSENNFTNFNVTLTPFIECPEDAFPFGNEHWRPCSTLDSFSCIPVEYFCDGVLNCGFPDEFGLDEIHCSKGAKKPLPIQDINSEIGDKNPRDEEFDDLYGSGENSPYDPFMSEEEPFVIPRFNTNQTIIIATTRKSHFYIKSGNAVGLLVIIMLFMALVSFSRMKASRDPGQVGVGVRPASKFDASSVTNLISNNDYDEEADPAPSYDLCISSQSLISLSECTQLHYEHEHPPSYEEVKVHGLSISQKLNV